MADLHYANASASSAPNTSLRFRTVRIKEVYFRNKLCEEFRDSRYAMPENLRKGRNVAIILGFAEMVCCIASLIFYFRRRSAIIILWIILNWIATGLGFWSKMRLSYCGLLAHAIYTISVIGGFYIYVFIDYALTKD